MKSKTGYRIWQFFQSLKQPPGDDDRKAAESILNPVELELFYKLPVPDQNHSLRVLESIQALGEDDQDLLKAALLHDLGKIKFPPKRWERIVAVLMAGLFPNQLKKWGEGKPEGLKRPLVVIRQHPDWGAELAHQAGCSSKTVWLIRHHEDGNPENRSSELNSLLDILQIADNQN